MKQGIVSATYLKMFLQCRKKFFFRYCTDKTPIITGDARAYGIALHSALEAMYVRLKDSNKRPTAADYDHVISVFLRQGINNQLSDQALYEEGKTILKSRLDKYDPSEKVLGLEVRFGHPYNAPILPVATSGGTPLTGAIDKLNELDKSTIVVIDYKSSHTALTDEEASKDEQLSLYDLVVSKLYPQYKNIIIVLDYLRLRPVITHRTEEQRASFEKFIDAVYEIIGEIKEEEIKPSLNEFCGWCDYRGYCTEYAKVLSDPGLTMKPVESMSEAEFVDEWSRFSSVQKAVDSYKRHLSMRASDIVRDKAKADIVGKDTTLYRVQSSRVYYDVPTVLNLLPKEDLINLISLQKGSVDKYLVDHPEYADAVSETANVSFSSSFFKQRKNK